MTKRLSYFSKTEWLLWSLSSVAVLLSFLLFDRESYLSLAASLMGVNSLIFCAKGNPLGQVFGILFGLLYAVISYGMAYYGEMIIYLGMSVPMAILILIAWLRNPYKGNRAEVRINRLAPREFFLLSLLTLAVTVIFYFVLRFFHTANLIPSTISIATSFAALYLSFRRSELFTLLYVANDLVLLVLWVMASFTDPGYISIVTCFFTFLINDLYAYMNWSRMKQRQAR